MNKTWTLDDGLKLVRALQPNLRKFNYHLTLGGSVLNNGESNKDLDLYFHPMKSGKPSSEDCEGLVDWLEKMWGESESIGEEYEEPENIDNPIPPGPIGMVDEDEAPHILFNNGVPQWIIRDNNDNPQLQNQPLSRTKKASNAVYQYKLKFIRPGGDRIDCFIL